MTTVTQYRYLEPQETIQEGDEHNYPDKHVAWRKCMSLGSKVELWGLSFRRPIRMQDATHRFLDYGEIIKVGDQFVSGQFFTKESPIRSVVPGSGVVGQPIWSKRGTDWRREIESQDSIVMPKTNKGSNCDLSFKDYQIKLSKEYRILESGDVIQEGDEIIGGTSGIGDRFEAWTKLNSSACCFGLDVDFYKNDFSFRRKVDETNEAKLQKEVKELKEKLRDTETAVYAYKELQKLLKVEYTVINEVKKLIQTVANPPKPKYIALKIGDVVQPGDEYRISDQCKYRRKVRY